MTEDDEMIDSPSTGGPYLADITEEVVMAQVDVLRDIWGHFGWHDKDWTKRWLTLAQLSLMTGQPEACVSANLRTLRKPKGGAHHVDVSKRGTKMWHYRVWKAGTHKTRHRHCEHYTMAVALGMINEDLVEEALNA